MVQLGHMVSEVRAASNSSVPLYLLRPGPAPEGSCGVDVAGAAGLPPALVSRARALAGRLEAAGRPAKRAQRARSAGSGAAEGGWRDRDVLGTAAALAQRGAADECLPLWRAARRLAGMEA